MKGPRNFAQDSVGLTEAEMMVVMGHRAWSPAWAEATIFSTLETSTQQKPQRKDVAIHTGLQRAPGASAVASFLREVLWLRCGVAR